MIYTINLMNDEALKIKISKRCIIAQAFLPRNGIHFLLI